MDTWINILTISICPRNVSIHMVIVLLYIYRFPKYRFDRFKSLSMWSQSDIFIFEITVNTDAVFVSNNIVLFSFFMEKYESKIDGDFHLSFPIVFIPTRTYTLCKERPKAQIGTERGNLLWHLHQVRSGALHLV